MQLNPSAVPKIWKPTAAGKLLARSPHWSLKLWSEQFSLVIERDTRTGPVVLLDGLSVTPGLIWSKITLPNTMGSRLKLGGLANAHAQNLFRAVRAAIRDVQHREAVAALLKQFDRQIGPIVAWADWVIAACKAQIKRRGWLSHDFCTKLDAGKPNELKTLFETAEIRDHLKRQPERVQDAVRFWQRPLADFAAGVNRRQAARMAEADRAFFDTVEKSPLTAEQRQAVMCLDSRVLLVAAAGSGKTSTMVVKAGYALRHGYFDASRMLLLAFNSDAAQELGERVKARLAPLGLSADQVVVKTFHAFGLAVIGEATGQRPSLAPWVESGQDQRALLAMVDELKDESAAFRTEWDLFRLVFSHDLPQFGKEGEGAEAWDRETRKTGFRTLQGEVLKSRGERLIANWLFYNGVRYAYERPYEHETADAAHRQYQPDFYLPDAHAYLEHWALDERGKPPEEFMGYAEGIAWKKKLHAEHHTTLLETTMAGVWSGDAFRYLEAELPKLGIRLDPNPDRPVAGEAPIENQRLIGTLRTFLTHVKGNRLTMAELNRRLAAGASGRFRFRHAMFLRLFERVWQRREAKLKAGDYIDFDDMLNRATDLIEAGRYRSPYELVMVDEFQDASQARARLVRSLLQGDDRYLFAVGDDWQSINRFAGADLGVMTQFEQRFGVATTLKLETTFRCPPSLCAISSAFVSRNPSQIAKAVQSAKPDVADPVRIMSVKDRSEVSEAVDECIQKIAEEAANAHRKTSVYILGRYRRDAATLPVHWDREHVSVEFMTAHGAKGLEADHIIVPGMISATMGFPSGIEDDPVLQLAMPGGDAFEYAEERRLFYVALTRARQAVTLVTVARRESAFVTELVRDAHLTIQALDGSAVDGELCPECHEGFLVKRSGRYGMFEACSNFPACRFTRNVPGARRGRGTARQHQARV